MSIVGAYIELKPGEELPAEDIDAEPREFQRGIYRGKTPEGLDVYFVGENTGEGPPPYAQVYLKWVPEVVATWREQEIEDEDGNGDEAEPAGPGLVEEDHEGPGDGGGEPGDSGEDEAVE